MIKKFPEHLFYRTLKYFVFVLAIIFLVNTSSCKGKSKEKGEYSAFELDSFVFAPGYILEKPISKIECGILEKKLGSVSCDSYNDNIHAILDTSLMIFRRSTDKYDSTFIPFYVSYTIENGSVKSVKYNWDPAKGILPAYENRYDEIDSLLKIRFGKPDNEHDNFPNNDSGDLYVATTRIDFGFYADWNKKPGISPEAHLHFHESYRKGESFITLEIKF
jgi:hypothetical protein